MPVEAKARERGWRVEAPLAAHALVFLDQQPGPASGSAATGRRAGGRGVGRAQPALQGELQRAAVVGGGEGKVAAGVLLAVEVHPQRVGEQRVLGLQAERDAAQLDQAGRVGLDVQAQARQHFGHRLALAEGQHLLERGGPFLGKRVRGQGDRRRLLAGQHRLPQQAVAAVGLAAFEDQAQARAGGPRGDADARYQLGALAHQGDVLVDVDLRHRLVIGDVLVHLDAAGTRSVRCGQGSLALGHDLAASRDQDIELHHQRRTDPGRVQHATGAPGLRGVGAHRVAIGAVKAKAEGSPRNRIVDAHDRRGPYQFEPGLGASAVLGEVEPACVLGLERELGGAELRLQRRSVQAERARAAAGLGQRQPQRTAEHGHASADHRVAQLDVQRRAHRLGELRLAIEGEGGRGRHLSLASGGGCSR